MVVCMMMMVAGVGSPSHPSQLLQSLNASSFLIIIVTGAVFVLGMFRGRAPFVSAGTMGRSAASGEHLEEENWAGPPWGNNPPGRPGAILPPRYQS